jgi:hypothetical protein
VSISEGEVMEVIVREPRHASRIRIEGVGGGSRLSSSCRDWGIIEPSSNEASGFKGFKRFLGREALPLVVDSLIDYF